MVKGRGQTAGLCSKFKVHLFSQTTFDMVYEVHEMIIKLNRNMVWGIDIHKKYTYKKERKYI